MPLRLSSPLRFHRMYRPFVLIGMAAAMYMTPVAADELSDVSQLLRAGQHTAALNKADAFLKQNPREPQMRFLKGVILTEQNKKTEAIDVFTRLTKDYPTLPEPYNNLAVLYASAGEYEKARAALDQAIRTNPAYATAYENLGDVHAKLASQAYDKALQLDRNNNAAQSKLTMVRTLVGSTALPPVAAVSPAPEPAPAPARPVPPPVVPDVKPRQPAVEAVPPPTVVAERKPEPAPVPPPVRPAEEDKRRAEQEKARAAADATRSEVLHAVDSWARAWSARDVGAYLNAYARDFALPAGQSRKVWETERRARIEDKKRISVQIVAPQVAVNGDTATVRFRQNYDSDRFKSDSRKTLVLKKQGSAWRIQQERTGN